MAPPLARCTLALALGLTAATASAADAGPTEPSIRVTLPWVLTQLVPSPELAVGDGAARFGMRWQVTPILFSWGIHRGLSPWRSLVVEPSVRSSGSIEAYVAPAYLSLGRSLADDVVLRTGVRSTFPLLAHGEYLSMSLGASHFLLEGRSGAAYEAGLYTLFGVVGAQLTVSPTGGPLACVATLALRYF